MPAWAIWSGRSPTRLLPFHRTSPTGSTSPMIALQVVERPTPLRPSRLTISPARASRGPPRGGWRLPEKGGRARGGRAGGGDRAVNQHGPHVGPVEDHAHVVLDHHERLARGHAADQGDRVI